MTDPGSLFTDGSDRTTFSASAAVGTAFDETQPTDFAKADRVERKQLLGTGGYAAAAVGATPRFDTGDVIQNSVQRINSICFQVNSACCLLMV